MRPLKIVAALTNATCHQIRIRKKGIRTLEFIHKFWGFYPNVCGARTLITKYTEIIERLW